MNTIFYLGKQKKIHISNQLDLDEIMHYIPTDILVDYIKKRLTEKQIIKKFKKKENKNEN